MSGDLLVLTESVEAPDPADARYVRVEEVALGRHDGYFNGARNPELLSVRVSGVKLAWAGSEATPIGRYAGAPNVRDITIAAHTIEIAKDLHLPQASVALYAKRLHLRNGARIITTPLPYPDDRDVGESGMAGAPAGRLSLFVDELVVDKADAMAFVTRGGEGQRAGAKGFAAAGSGGNDDRWHQRDMPAIPLTREGLVNGTLLHSILKVGMLRNTEIAMSGAWRWPNVADYFPDLDHLATRVVWLKVVVGGKNLYEIGARKKPWDGDVQTPPGKRGPGGAGGDLVSRVPVHEDLRYQDPGRDGAMSAEGLAVGPGSPNPGYFVEIELMPAENPTAKSWVKVERFDLADVAKCGQAGVAQGGGGPGNYALVDAAKTPYLTFQSLELIVAYARDAFRGGSVAAAQAMLQGVALTEAQLKASRQAWAKDAQLDETTVVKTARALIAEAAAMRGRAARQLDYFGNPAGWVPLLSAGTNAALYREQIGSALKVIGLASTISARWDQLKNKADLLEASLKELQHAQVRQKNARNSALDKFAVLRRSLDAMDDERKRVEKAITALRIDLYKKAKDGVLKKLDWERFEGVVKMLAGAACLLPVGQPYARLATDAGEKLSSTMKAFATDPEAPTDLGTHLKPAMESAKGLLEKLSAKAKEDPDEGEDADEAPSWLSEVDVGGAVDRFAEGIRPFLVSAADIDARIEEELAKLENAEPRIADLKSRVAALQSMKQDLVGQLLQQSAAIQAARAAIRKKQQMIDTAKAQAKQAAKPLNPALKALARQMQQEAMDGINQYLYYLARAYEFHALKAAPLAESADKLAESLTALFADRGEDASWSKSDFDAKIADILEVQFGKILDKIRNELVAGLQSRTQRNKVRWPVACNADAGKPVFDALYEQLIASGAAQATLSPERLGYGYKEEDGASNARIANVELTEIAFEPVADKRMPTAVVVKLSHPGLSVLRASKNEPAYAFVATGGVEWGATCQFVRDGAEYKADITPFGPSDGDKELWAALKLPDNLARYHPGYHSDLVLSVQTSPADCRVRIKGLQLQFTLEV